MLGATLLAVLLAPHVHHPVLLVLKAELPVVAALHSVRRVLGATLLAAPTSCLSRPPSRPSCVESSTPPWCPPLHSSAASCNLVGRTSCGSRSPCRPSCAQSSKQNSSLLPESTPYEGRVVQAGWWHFLDIPLEQKYGWPTEPESRSPTWGGSVFDLVIIFQNIGWVGVACLRRGACCIRRDNNTPRPERHTYDGTPVFLFLCRHVSSRVSARRQRYIIARGSVSKLR